MLGFVLASPEKKQLEDVLRGNKFLQLVNQHVKKVPTTPKTKQQTKTPAKAQAKTPAKAQAKTPAKTPSNKRVTTSDAPSTTKKKKQVTISTEPQQKQPKQLEMIAKELECTELAQQIKESMLQEENLPTSQVIKESMDVLLSPVQSIEPVPDVCIDCVLLKSQVDTLQQEVGTLQNQMQSMHQQIQSSQNLQNQVHEMSSRISNLQYYVQWLWNKQQTSNHGNTQQCQTIQNENQASTPSHAATRPTESANTNTEQQPSRSFQTDDSAANFSAESMEVEEEQVAVLSEDHEDERPDFFNNYSKEILEAKVLKIKDFSKCSKILLRLLYTDAERQGRSVTGTASCKKYAAKPALGHPERLKALYDIVMKRWTHVTIPEINKKLAEALKPSAS